VKAIGGLVAVAIGIIAVAAIAIVALEIGTKTAETIAASTAGVIATLVGAYFGVKVGTDQSRNALEGQRQEAAKAQVYAAHLPPEHAGDIVDMAQAIARGESPQPQ
jgi:hypothetical protein